MLSEMLENQSWISSSLPLLSLCFSWPDPSLILSVAVVIFVRTHKNLLVMWYKSSLFKTYHRILVSHYVVQ